MFYVKLLLGFPPLADTSNHNSTIHQIRAYSKSTFQLCIFFDTDSSIKYRTQHLKLKNKKVYSKSNINNR